MLLVPEPVPIPSTPDDITAEWLGDALRAHAADVTGVDIVEVHEVTNTHVKRARDVRGDRRRSRPTCS